MFFGKRRETRQVILSEAALNPEFTLEDIFRFSDC